MPRDEWDFWTGDTARERLPQGAADGMLGVFAQQLPALRDAGMLELVSGETEILPGVRLIPAPGHTPGHAAVELRSDGATALWLADAVLHELDFAHPHLVSVVDVDPELTVRTRRELLERAADESALVGGFHLGRVGRVRRRAGDSYELVAVAE
jgi:glyoxylase-like metal-dependent hydrolase (beta-lactamase superfamily II)